MGVQQRGRSVGHAGAGDPGAEPAGRGDSGDEGHGAEKLPAAVRAAEADREAKKPNATETLTATIGTLARLSLDRIRGASPRSDSEYTIRDAP